MTTAYLCSVLFLLKHNKMFSSHGGSLFFAMYDHRETIQLELPRNCLGQFREIPWNQTTDVHRGSTLITRVLRDAEVKEPMSKQ